MKYFYHGKEIIPVVEMTHELVAYLGNISLKTFFLDKKACANAWKTAEVKLKECFGDYLPMRTPMGSPISYGHLVCLGAELEVPEYTDPNIHPFAQNIDEALEIAQRADEVSFEDQPIIQHYLEIWEYLKKAFPEKKIDYAGPGVQGPFTTAVLMRGQDFYCDLYDEPEKCTEFLKLLTDNILKYHAFLNRMNGITEAKGNSCGLFDDFSSLVSPDMWEEMVIPCWNQYYEGRLLPGGWRFVHAEGLSPRHLPKLKLAKINHYQPSVSDLIRLEDAVEQCGKAYDQFDWLLYSYRITEMSDAEIEAWVERTLEAGVSTLRTQVGEYAFKIGKIDRINAFFKAFEKYRVE